MLESTITTPRPANISVIPAPGQKKRKRRNRSPPPSPPSPPPCPPLYYAPILYSLTPTWVGNFTAGLQSFAENYEGNFENPEYPDSLIFGQDPTILNSTDTTYVAMVTLPANVSGASTAASFFVLPYDARSIGISAKLTYDVYFEPDFFFGSNSSSGVLPGLFGGPMAQPGDADNEPQMCIPGEGGSEGFDECFSVHPVWGANGEGVISINAPQDDQSCQVWATAQFTDNGMYMGRGTWYFEANEWYSVEIYVQLNSFDMYGVPSEDGLLQVKVGGLERLGLSSMVWRVNANVTIDAMHFGTYWVNTPSTPIEQHILFRNVNIETPSLPTYPPPPAPPLPPPSPRGKVTPLQRRRRRNKRLALLRKIMEERL